MSYALRIAPNPPLTDSPCTYSYHPEGAERKAFSVNVRFRDARASHGASGSLQSEWQELAYPVASQSGTRRCSLSQAGHVAHRRRPEQPLVLAVEVRGVAISHAVARTGGVNIVAAATHGIIGLSKSAALDYAAEKIRINVVAPGIIDTEMMDRFSGGTEEGRQSVIGQEPVGRMGQPEEIAAAVLYLCSDEAAFTTGAVLVVDGGQTV